MNGIICTKQNEYQRNNTNNNAKAMTDVVLKRDE